MDGHALAVVSGKGGVGKTATVVDLAVRRRMNELSVAIVDADLAMPDIHNWLGLNPDTTLHDTLTGDVSPENAITETTEGFGLLLGNPSLAEYGEIDPNRLAQVMDTVTNRYDTVLIDTGAGLNYENLSAIDQADHVLLVSTPDEMAIENTLRTAELINRSPTVVQGAILTRVKRDVDVGQVTDRLGAMVLETIPEDPAVKACESLGQPLELHAPDSDAASAYSRLADAVLSVGPDGPDGRSNETPGQHGVEAVSTNTG